MGDKGRPWDEKELATLREMAGKYKAMDIGEAVGRGESGVNKMLKKLGLPSYVQYPKKEPVPAPVRRVEMPSRIKAWIPTPDGLRKVEEPQRARRGEVVYPPLEYCQNCSSPVSNWTEHVSRMQHMGCSRPPA